MDPVQRQPRKYRVGDFMFKRAEPTAREPALEGQLPEDEVGCASDKYPSAVNEQTGKQSAPEPLSDGEGKENRATEGQWPLCGVDDSGNPLRHLQKIPEMKTDPIDQAPSLLAYPVHSRHV